MLESCDVLVSSKTFSVSSKGPKCLNRLLLVP